MRAVIQRVTKASVEVEEKKVGAIGRGLLVLLGVGQEDEAGDSEWLVDKILKMRIFEKEGKFDLSLLDIDGELLVVSQFTLFGDCTRGRRPSFTGAMDAEGARHLFEHFVKTARGRLRNVECGIFQASMSVSLVNDGPVTLVIDSRK